MKREFLKLFITVGTLLTCNLFASLDNISFEDADRNPNKAAHWGVWGVGLERVTGWVPNFDGEAMIAYRHWELPVGHTASAGIFQDAYNIEAGKSYEFSLSVYTDYPESGDIKGRIELRLESTIDGKQVTLNSQTKSFESYLGAWRKISVTGVPPVDNMRAVVEFFPSNSSTRGGAIKVDLPLLTTL